MLAAPAVTFSQLLTTILAVGALALPAAVGSVTVTDALGRSVALAAAARRVVSLAPSNTEILFAVGAGDAVVGVTTFCNYPAEAARRAKVGGFAAGTISLETLVALRPDLVLAGDQDQRAVVDSLEALRVPVISVKARDFDGLYQSIELIGRVTGKAAEASELVAGLRRRVTAVEDRVAARGPAPRWRVYWEVFDAPVMTAGRRSIIGQLIEKAGGVNVFSDLAEEYATVSMEAVVARNPQVILAPDMNKGDPLTAEKLRRRPGWERIEAVRQGRVAVVSADLTSRPGPRLVAGLEQVAAVLYPENHDGGAP